MDGDSFFSEHRAGTPEQEASQATQVAAQNLLDKVADALEAGDEARARSLAEKAAALPFDDHEEMWPGVAVAGQSFFDEVSDLVEVWPDDDASWVEVLAESLPTLDGWARQELEHVIGVLWHDAGLLSVTEREEAALKRLTAGTEVDLDGPSMRVPREEQTAYVLEVVQLGLRLLPRLEERLEEL